MVVMVSAAVAVSACLVFLPFFFPSIALGGQGRPEAAMLDQPVGGFGSLP